MLPPTLISICIPTYNGEKYIAETLASVSSQTFRNFEVIISDNLSTDNTLDTVNEWKDQQSFPVHVFSNKDKGIGNNWNFCVEKSIGKYIKFIFQDDVMREDCLERMMAVFVQNPQIKFVACKRKFIDSSTTQDKKLIKAWINKYQNLQSQFMNDEDYLYVVSKNIFKQDHFFQSPTNKIGEPSAVMFEKSIIKKVGLFNTKLVQILDFEYWYRVLIYYDITIISEPLVSFRLHDRQETHVNRSKQISEYPLYMEFVYRTLFFHLSFSKQFSLLEERFVMFRYIRAFYGKTKKLITDR